DARGVRGEDRGWLADAVEFRKNLALLVEVFDDRFDDQVAVLQIRQGGSAREVVQGQFRLSRGRFSPFHAFGQGSANAVHALLEDLLVDLPDDRRMALLGA